MNLKEFVSQLQKVIENDPISADMEVIYSSDEEGNSFQKIYSLGGFMKIVDLEERYLDMDYDDEDDDSSAFRIEDCNAFCIN
jgi:hypothetical protein